MKDETRKPLEALGDEALEARIVAWVLGEASAFEAAELEERCAGDAELKRFADRMREVHQLIEADEKSVAGDDWKLPEEKRRKVVDLLGVEPVVRLESRKQWRFPVRIVSLAAAACLMGALMLWGMSASIGSKAMKSRAMLASHETSASDFRDAGSESRSRERSSTDFDAIPQPNVGSGMGGQPIDRAFGNDRGQAGGPSKDPFAESESARKSNLKMEDSSDLEALAKIEPEAEAAEVPELGELSAPAQLSGMMGAQADENRPQVAAKPGEVSQWGLKNGSDASADSIFDVNQRSNELLAGYRVGSDFGSPPASTGLDGSPSWSGSQQDGQAKDLSDGEAAFGASIGGGISDESLNLYSGIDTDQLRFGDADSSNGADHQDLISRVSGQTGPVAETEPIQASGEDSTKLARNEVLLRQSTVAESAQKRDESREHDAAGRYKVAQQEPVKPIGTLHDYPHFLQTGNSGEGWKLLESAKQQDPENRYANDDLAAMNDPVYPNQAGTGGHRETLGEIRRELYEAEGAFELGKFDQAKEKYEEVVRTDPGNTAARRGLERVDAAKSDYYRAAYDQTRAALLAEVNETWEMAVPPDSRTAESKSTDLGGEAHVGLGNRDEFHFDDEAPKMPADDSLAAAEERLKKLKREVGAPAIREAKLSQMSDGSEKELADLRALKMDLLDREVGSDDGQLAGLENALQTQRDAVEDKRKTLETIQRNRSLSYQFESNLSEKEALSRKEQKAVQQGIGLHGFDDAAAEFKESKRLLKEIEQQVDQLKGTAAIDAAIEAGEPIPKQDAKSIAPSPEARDNSTTLDAMTEISAADEAFSTFSMHVSDASFKLAAAAMERGEVPAAESVRPEEFYNAFDYGDPAPTANEPVACAVEQCAHPAFPQRNLLRIAVRTGSEGRAQSKPLNLTLLLDNSGSMEREDRALGLNKAVEGLTSLLKEGDTVTVAGFSRQPRLLADRVDGKDAASLNGLVTQTPAEGGTNLEEALKLGGDLAKRQFKEGAQNRVVLFTDGAANLGDADPESLNGKVEQLRNEGIAFDAAGFGADGLNDRLLERLTRNGNGRYYVVDDASDADSGFAKQLAGAFRPAAENVKVQVVFNPSRVGNYKLIGFEEHRLKKEDFRNDAVDAAEMASEEAGVALYQFEVLPDGQGEVGEVSIRFRDTSTGEMVEQSWPIPYDPQVPSFDQAKPGIQLAGIAAFVAEKLRSAPMAEAIDYSELRGVMARVKAEYQGNDRVGQLERMMRR